MKFKTILLVTIIFFISVLVDILTGNWRLLIPLSISSLISGITTKWGIQKLKKIKAGQIIREEGPKDHLKKSGTPNMGGIIIIPIGLIVGFIVNLNHGLNKEIIAISFLAISFMLIGFIDDWQSIKLKKNTGLTPKEKLILQIIVGTIFLIFISSGKFIEHQISFIGNSHINLGMFFWPIILLILIAESNATNLTDGLDGLASGCGAIIFTGLAIELMLRGSNESYAFASLCIAIAGSWIGFLIHNQFPAKIFMGDTGSLAMGGTLVAIALLSDALWSLFIMSGVFILEALSVIIQVGLFKATKTFYGKGYRFFLMAPIHHHFELQGNKETKIVESFWLISICCIFIALSLRSSI